MQGEKWDIIHGGMLIKEVIEHAGDASGSGAGGQGTGATGEGGGGVLQYVQGGAELGGALGGGEFVAEGVDELLLAGDGIAVFYAGGALAQGCKAALCGSDVGAGGGICHGGGE